MKSSGIVKKVGAFGIFALPRILRLKFSIDTKDPVEFFIEGETIILKKCISSCIFCGEAKGTHFFKGKQICEDCIDMLKT